MLELLAEQERPHYLVDGGEVLRRRPEAPDVLARFGAGEREEWGHLQRHMMDGAIQGTDKMLDASVVRSRWSAYDRVFARRGPLEGDVLDIGGGWGLFREWWSAREGERFIVHDPGIERFERGVYDIHREVYRRAIARPMTFVEGYGEHLPYPSDRFDTIMTAAALDHCVSPERVFAEAFRCTAPGGRFVAIEHIEDIARVAPERARMRARLMRVARDPARVVGYVTTRLRRDQHIQHFTSTSLQRDLKKAGFIQVSLDLIDPETRFVIVEGKKPLVP